MRNSTCRMLRSLPSRKRTTLLMLVIMMCGGFAAGA